MGKSAPSAPDPYQTAAAQTQSNEQTAAYNQKLNEINSYGPNGSVVYSVDPSAPGGYAQTTTLSPAQQAIYNGQTSTEAGALGIANDQLGRVSSALQTSLNPSDYGSLTTSASGGQMAGQVGAPSLQSSYGNGGAIQYGYGSGGQVQSGLGQQGPIATSYGSGGSIQGSVTPSGQVQSSLGAAGSQQAITDAQNAAYNTQAQYLDPQFAQQGEQLQSQLAAQGLNPNDAAYANAMQQFNAGKNQAYQGAMNAAVTAGQNEQNTLFSQSLGAGNFSNAAQAQQYGENLSSGQFANSAQAQANSQNANAAAFQNAGQQQGYGQALGAGQFYNAAQQQRNTQAQQAAGFNNQSVAQQYAQNAGNAAFYNAATNSGFQNQLAAAELQNSEQNQGYNQAYQNAQLGNTAQQQAFQQAAYSTELPINELSGLLGLGQVSSPTGVSYTPASAQSTNVGGIVQNAYQDQLQSYNANQQQTQSMLGGLFNLGSAFL